MSEPWSKPPKSGPDWNALNNIPTLIPPPSKAILTRLAQERLGVTDPKTNLTNALMVVDAWIEKAKTGDVEAIKVLLDRVEGKVPQASTLDVTGKIEHEVKRMGDNELDYTIIRAARALGIPPEHLVLIGLGTHSEDGEA